MNPRTARNTPVRFEGDDALDPELLEPVDVNDLLEGVRDGDRDFASISLDIDAGL